MSCFDTVNAFHKSTFDRDKYIKGHYVHIQNNSTSDFTIGTYKIDEVDTLSVKLTRDDKSAWVSMKAIENADGIVTRASHQNLF